MNRRSWLQGIAALLALAVLTPLRALAALWNKPAFEADNVDEALRDLGVTTTGQSRLIVLIAPDMAENGAIVQIEVESLIPDTEAIAILAEKNPTPLLANYIFGESAVPYVITRIKMVETAGVKAIVKAGGKYYSASKNVNVAAGSCG